MTNINYKQEQANKEMNVIQELNGSDANKTKKVSKFERPGPLVNEVQLVLNTIDAQTAFMGHGAKGAVGLLQFGSRMAELWEASERDDPYADFYLLKVYDAMIQLRNQLALAIQSTQHQLNQMNKYAGFILTPFQSERPLIKTLRFRTPYGYLGASVVADFDELMRMVLTAKRVGVMLEKSHEELRNEWLVQIMVLFKLPFKWQDFHITRADVEAKNKISQQARKVLSKLPESVLTKKLRAPFAPHINVINRPQQEIVNIIQLDEVIETKMTDVSVSISQTT